MQQQRQQQQQLCNELGTSQCQPAAAAGSRNSRATTPPGAPQQPDWRSQEQHCLRPESSTPTPGSSAAVQPMQLLGQRSRSSRTSSMSTLVRKHTDHPWACQGCSRAQNVSSSSCLQGWQAQPAAACPLASCCSGATGPGGGGGTQHTGSPKAAGRGGWEGQVAAWLGRSMGWGGLGRILQGIPTTSPHPSCRTQHAAAVPVNVVNPIIGHMSPAVPDPVPSCPCASPLLLFPPAGSWWPPGPLHHLHQVRL
jgi:hypothetical protein